MVSEAPQSRCQLDDSWDEVLRPGAFVWAPRNLVKRVGKGSPTSTGFAMDGHLNPVPFGNSSLLVRLHISTR